MRTFMGAPVRTRIRLYSALPGGHFVAEAGSVSIWDEAGRSGLKAAKKSALVSPEISISHLVAVDDNVVVYDGAGEKVSGGAGIVHWIRKEEAERGVRSATYTYHPDNLSSSALKPNRFFLMNILAVSKLLL
jgi:hypothetical protein